jgi:hypothetical protein
MTAINVIKQLDCVHIVSDGAVIRSDGRVDHFAQKVTIMPHLSAAVGIRGTPAAANFINAEIAKATSYSNLKSTIVRSVRAVLDVMRPHMESQFGPHVLTAEIFVVGWSVDGPDAFILNTSDLNKGSGVPAWTVVNIGGLCLGPSDSTIASDFSRLQVELTDDRLVELLHRQRELRNPLPHDPTKEGPRAIGGFAQLTSVRKDSITTRILKRWPDRVGEKIQAIAA